MSLGGVLQPKLRIGLVCPDLVGHLNPMTTLGTELASRGHSVALIGGRSSQPVADHARLGFHPIGADGDLDRKLSAALRRLGDFGGYAVLAQAYRCGYWQTKMLLRDLPGLIEAQRYDVLVVDQFSPAGCVVSERLGIPTVIACNALAIVWPPLAPRLKQRGPIWNLLKRAPHNWFCESVLPAVYRRAPRDFIDPMMLCIEQNRGHAIIAQQPAIFDLPHVSPPDNFHYTAPWHRADRDDEDADFPWDWLDGRPLVYASVGTLGTRFGRVFRALVEAVRGLSIQLVLAPGRTAHLPSGGLPDNVLVVDRAPQLRLLDRASLAVTHAGMNTVLECLVRGVPMLCIPFSFDQPFTAHRVEWHGLGETMLMRQVTAQRLRDRLQAALASEHYRRTARDFSARLREIDGVAMAAEVVESAAFTGTRVAAGRAPMAGSRTRLVGDAA